MTFEQLFCFIEVYRLKSITQAAENLFISRPSLSRSIHRLEKEFDVVLFTRSTNGVEPTAAGHEFYKFAQIILNNQDLLSQKMLSYSNHKKPMDICKIGLSKSLFSTYGHILLDTLSDSFPNIYFDFSLCQKTTRQNFYLDFDISIILLPSGETKRYWDNLDEKYKIFHLSTFPISIWISAKSPLSSFNTITNEMLSDYSFCSLKNHFNMNNLIGVLGYDRSYYQNSSTVELERNLVDKIEKFQYYTIDFPIYNGEYMYTELFNNHDVILKKTDEIFNLEIIYRKETCQDFYSSISNIFTNS